MSFGFGQGKIAEVDAGLTVLQIREPQGRVESNVIANHLESVSEETNGAIDRVLAPAPAFVPRAEVALVGVQVVDRTLGEPPVVFRREPQLEGIDDDGGETLLHREDVVDGAVVGVGPDMIVRARIDQLSRNPQPVSGPANTAFEEVAHSQLAGNRLHILRRASEHHG